jgi:hypothetical protein
VLAPAGGTGDGPPEGYSDGLLVRPNAAHSQSSPISSVQATPHRAHFAASTPCVGVGVEAGRRGSPCAVLPGSVSLTQRRSRPRSGPRRPRHLPVGADPAARRPSSRVTACPSSLPVLSCKTIVAEVREIASGQTIFVCEGDPQGVMATVQSGLDARGRGRRGGLTERGAERTWAGNRSPSAPMETAGNDVRAPRPHPSSRRRGKMLGVFQEPAGPRGLSPEVTIAREGRACLGTEEWPRPLPAVRGGFARHAEGGEAQRPGRDRLEKRWRTLAWAIGR